MTDSARLPQGESEKGFSLRRISQGIGRLQADAGDDAWIRGICDDSRKIKPGYALICLPRCESNAGKYAEQAREGGASAIICVAMTLNNTGLPTLHLDSMQQAGRLLRRLFDTEQAATHLFGVTGTDGKTSVIWMLREALMRYRQKKVWNCGTLGWVKDGDDILDIGNTTPSMLTMHAMFSAACLEGVESLICEISSHGIAQERIAGLDFNTAIWIGMGHDHLQDHGGYPSYLATKAKFIRACAQAGGNVICNADYADIRNNAPAGARWYGRGLYRDDVDLAWEQEFPGILRLHDGEQEVVVEGVPLGDFHAENVACVALTLITSQQIGMPDLPGLLGDISAPPGRMQDIASALGQVFIDYAHTPEALERCLRAARKFTHRRLLLVFGCGGDRDREKRPQMGAIAVDIADMVWITSDNSRTEMTEVIASEIEAGMPRPYAAAVHLQLDRELAIAEAIAELKQGDTLIIAGKGHETYMECGGKRTPWSDADVAARYLRNRQLAASDMAEGEPSCS
jgi:UDP-N-acetylmuramoyl-L-alanyl-D-glutamate--2,6-diaminopimelate ligase